MTEPAEHTHWTEYEMADCHICRPPPKRTCNLHTDCDAADDEARAKGKVVFEHCSDSGCEDCFGN